MSRSYVSLSIVVVILIATLSGCGGGASDNSKITSTIKSYLTAVANGNGQAACAELTPAAAQQVRQDATSLGATGCADAINRVSASIGAAKQALLKAKITSITITGSTATAQLQGGTRAPKLQKVGGRWLIAGGLGS